MKRRINPRNDVATAKRNARFRKLEGDTGHYPPRIRWLADAYRTGVRTADDMTPEERELVMEWLFLHPAHTRRRE